MNDLVRGVKLDLRKCTFILAPSKSIDDIATLNVALVAEFYTAYKSYKSLNLTADIKAFLLRGIIILDYVTHMPCIQYILVFLQKCAASIEVPGKENT